MYKNLFQKNSLTEIMVSCNSLFLFDIKQNIFDNYNILNSTRERAAKIGFTVHPHKTPELVLIAG